MIRSGISFSQVIPSIFIILIFPIQTTFSIRIGVVSNATFLGSMTSQTFTNLTCEQCRCAALMASAVGWNCMRNNRTCQLIRNYSFADIGLRQSNDTTFFFQQFPPKSSSSTTEKMTTETVTTMTTSTVYSSM